MPQSNSNIAVNKIVGKIRKMLPILHVVKKTDFETYEYCTVWLKLLLFFSRDKGSERRAII